jgi:hypothetical protein
MAGKLNNPKWSIIVDKRSCPAIMVTTVIVTPTRGIRNTGVEIIIMPQSPPIYRYQCLRPGSSLKFEYDGKKSKRTSINRALTQVTIKTDTKKPDLLSSPVFITPWSVVVMPAPIPAIISNISFMIPPFKIKIRK